MSNFGELYQQQLKYNAAKSPYLVDFKNNPYSFLKARYYMFFASVIVYFIRDSSIHPNTITKIYIFMGFLGAALLAIPITPFNYLALLLIFSKGILDWADGHLARINENTSLTGHVLDIYGARIHSITFSVALGIYEYYLFGKNELFLFALFIYPFCYGTLLTKFSYRYIFDSITKESKSEITDSHEPSITIDKKYKKTYSFFSLFLDDRSRTIDFVLLLILIELNGGPALSWIFFVGVNIKWIALWCGSFIFSSKKNSLDKILTSKLNELRND
tara:strand:+ start:3865 stop:4686 length:822 start_codon:yes stop_codon:yes gene_type:complete